MSVTNSSFNNKTTRAELGLDTTDDVEFNSLNTPNHIYGAKCGAFAYLATPTTTTIAVAGTYQYVEGVFTNVGSSEFDTTLVNTDEPAIKYTGTKTRYFKVLFAGTVKAGTNGTTAKVAFKKNGVVCACAEMEVFCKTADEAFSFAGIGIVELATDDTVQLVCTSDGMDELTFDMFQTDISPKFNI